MTMQAYVSDDWLLEEMDIFLRAIGNPKISHAYCRLYMITIDCYPSILTGELITNFDPREIREKAGKVSRESASKFFRDLKEIGAVLHYDPGEGMNTANGRIQGNPEIMPYPETFALSETAQRKKELDAQRARNAARTLIMQCEECGSRNLRRDLLTVCKDCNHRHIPMVDVDATRLFDDKPECTTEDGFFPEPDIPAQPVPAPVTIPRCQNLQCILGPKRVTIRPQSMGSGFYCENHRGYIDEQGRPI